MGEVYRADDLTLGQPVALKFLPEKLAEDSGRLERFDSEVRLALQVSHPNVCRIHDVGKEEGKHFLSMEYIDGEDLASLLRRIGRLPQDKALEIARQLCAGLAAAHEKGVLHRDLKPVNVMIGGRGKVRIADFGLARTVEDVRDPRVLEGTPAYMAPEQFAGKGESIRSDLYSLGLVLYELFTGKPAFKATTLTELVRLHREVNPTNPSMIIADIDPVVARVILRCLEKDPALPGPFPASAGFKETMARGCRNRGRANGDQRRLGCEPPDRCFARVVPGRRVYSAVAPFWPFCRSNVS
jgi:serine/threonine protein kinase